MRRIIYLFSFLVSFQLFGFSGLVSSSKIKFWPDGRMPIFMESGFSEKQKQNIIKAAALLTKQTNVSVYVIGDESEASAFVRVKPGNSGCSARTGYQPGMNYIKISKRCKLGNIIHEMVHALGFKHEHLHPHGPQIFLNKIQTGKEHNYKLEEAKAYSEYDPDSIMHYSSTGFTICDDLEDRKWLRLKQSQLPHRSCHRKDWRSVKPENNNGVNCRLECATLLTADGKEIGRQRKGLSPSDIAGINKAYPKIS